MVIKLNIHKHKYINKCKKIINSNTVYYKYNLS